MDVDAIQSIIESMVVSGGWKYAASSILSKPITCTLSGTVMASLNAVWASDAMSVRLSDCLPRPCPCDGVLPGIAGYHRRQYWRQGMGAP